MTEKSNFLVNPSGELSVDADHSEVDPNLTLIRNVSFPFFLKYLMNPDPKSVEANEIKIQAIMEYRKAIGDNESRLRDILLQHTDRSGRAYEQAAKAVETLKDRKHDEYNFSYKDPSLFLYLRFNNQDPLQMDEDVRFAYKRLTEIKHFADLRDTWSHHIKEKERTHQYTAEYFTSMYAIVSHYDLYGDVERLSVLDFCNVVKAYNDYHEALK